MSHDRPVVQLLATGGTIANPPDVEGYISGRKLVAEVPEVEARAEMRVEDVASVASQSLTPRTLFDLRERCVEALGGDDPANGVVVTAGSNALEEVAYFLNLTVEAERPVVLTAAQRNRGTLGNDGDRNLVDAVTVAGHPDARRRGALVVVNDEIHPAREVRKVVSSRPDAWSSGNFGVLGGTDKHGRVSFYRDVERRHTVTSAFVGGGYDPEVLRQVHVVYASLGDDGTTVEAAVERDARGIVVAGYPTGSPATPADYPGQAEALDAAAEAGVPVVMCHRGYEGWTYAYLGGSRYDSLVAADDLAPAKARILLALACQKTDDLDELRSLFREH